MATIRIRAGQSRAKPYFVLSVVAGLGLLIGLGVGWQTQLRGHGNKTAVTASQQAETSAPQGGAALESDVPAATEYVPPASVTGQPSYVLVGSSDQQSEVSRGIEDANVIRAEMGLAPLDVTVWNFVTEADEADTMAALSAENSFRDLVGMPVIRVVDLRN